MFILDAKAGSDLCVQRIKELFHVSDSDEEFCVLETDEASPLDPDEVYQEKTDQASLET